MTMTNERREKLLSRLRKCMALSASPEAHEAAAALRQAQKLMAELGIDEGDLHAMEVRDALVKTREGFGRCLTMAHLVSLIKAAFAVDAVQEPNPGTAARLNVRYFGREDRVQLAEYAHRVVWRAMEAAWDRHLAARPELKSRGGQRQAFHVGWLTAVRRTVEAIAPSHDEARAIAAWKAKTYPVLGTSKFQGRRLDTGALVAGAAAAKDFRLHRPVGAEDAGEGPAALGYSGK